MLGQPCRQPLHPIKQRAAVQLQAHEGYPRLHNTLEPAAWLQLQLHVAEFHAAQAQVWGEVHQLGCTTWTVKDQAINMRAVLGEVHNQAVGVLLVSCIR